MYTNSMKNLHLNIVLHPAKNHLKHFVCQNEMIDTNNLIWTTTQHYLGEIPIFNDDIRKMTEKKYEITHPK